MPADAAWPARMLQHLSHLPATRADIDKVIGAHDDGLITRIAATRVTCGELLEAYLLLAGDDQFDSPVGEPTGGVAQINQLLTEEQTRRGSVDV